MVKKFIGLFLSFFFMTSSFPVLATQHADINIGEYILLGHYHSSPILWRCVDIDDNGPLMLSDKILCLKPFDAAGENTSGSHARAHGNGQFRKEKGSNYWADSNIRSWLNSTQKVYNVDWLCGNPPTAEKVKDGYNAYANEKGFLADGNFNANERSVMKAVTQKSLLNGTEYTYPRHPDYHIYDTPVQNILQNYETAYSEQITDKVFLPDIKQIHRIYEKSDLLGENYHLAKPTQKAVNNSDFQSSRLEVNKNYDYWLRSPYAENNYGYEARHVFSEGTVNYYFAYDGSIGVRPAFYLDLSSVYYKSGEGTATKPYKILGVKNNTCLEVGDYIVFGKYYNQPILWRCVDIDYNGPLMLSDKIISIKPLDGKGPHPNNYNNLRSDFGSNLWIDSNIRAWLNSEGDAGEVVWPCGNPPHEGNVEGGYNAYANEAGFLSNCNFTQSERNLLQQVTQKSILNEVDAAMATMGSEMHGFKHRIYNAFDNYDTAFAHNVTDRMFLLDVKQVYRVYENLFGYYLGQPTQQAIDNSGYQDPSLKTANDWQYWLRTPSGSKSFACCTRVVDRYGDIGYYFTANSSQVGIRPAFYIEEAAAAYVSGNGNEGDPFVLSEPKDKFELEVWHSGSLGTFIKTYNNSTENLNLRLFIAEYDEGNKLIEFIVDNIFVNAGEYGVSLVNQPQNECNYFKAFLWDDNLSPMAKSICFSEQ